MEETRQTTMDELEQVQPAPDKADYMNRILSLTAEDQAFMDGYLFAKVTEAAKKGA